MLMLCCLVLPISCTSAHVQAGAQHLVVVEEDVTEVVSVTGEVSHWWVKKIPLKLIVIQTETTNDKGEEVATLLYQGTNRTEPVETVIMRVDVNLLDRLPDHIVQRKP